MKITLSDLPDPSAAAAAGHRLFGHHEDLCLRLISGPQEASAAPRSPPPRTRSAPPRSMAVFWTAWGTSHVSLGRPGETHGDMPVKALPRAAYSEQAEYTLYLSTLSTSDMCSHVHQKKPSNQRRASSPAHGGSQKQLHSAPCQPNTDAAGLRCLSTASSAHAVPHWAKNWLFLPACRRGLHWLVWSDVPSKNGNSGNKIHYVAKHSCFSSGGILGHKGHHCNAKLNGCCSPLSCCASTLIFLFSCSGSLLRSHHSAELFPVMWNTVFYDTFMQNG